VLSIRAGHSRGHCFKVRSLIGVVPSRHLVTGAIGNCTIWAGKEFENVMGYIIRSNIFLLNKYFFKNGGLQILRAGGDRVIGVSGANI